ncbi:MAG: pentapeptide repeat-containing protein [Bellilinea sp.]
MHILDKIHDAIDNFRLMQRDIELLGRDYFIIRMRSFRKATFFAIFAKLFGSSIKIVVFIFILGLLIYYLYSQPWSGLNTLSSSPGQSSSPKTLWDWLDLLIIPIALAYIAFYLRKNEALTVQKEADEHYKEQAINSYFQHIQDVLLTLNLEDAGIKQDASVISTARTLTLLQTLDPDRKSLVLKFLYEAKLIKGDNPFISLRRADLRQINYDLSSLSHADLSSVDFEQATFEKIGFENAMLTASNLRRSTLAFASLIKANLEYSNLDEADFYRANLREASLIRASARKINLSSSNLEKGIFRNVDFFQANLRKANLKGANLRWAQLEHANLEYADLRKADLTEANLMYANLKGADMTEAILKGTIVSRAQLRQAKTIEGAIIENIKNRLGPPQKIDTQKINDEIPKPKKDDEPIPSWAKRP